MIQVIHRAFDIIELFAYSEEKTMSLTEISNKMELKPSTCANILRSMTERGYISKGIARKGYSLGPKFKQIYEFTQYHSNLIQVASPLMSDLAIDFEEGLILSVLIKNKRKIIFEMPSPKFRDLKVIHKFEKHVYSSSTGRLLLALMPKNEIMQFINTNGLPDKGIWPGVHTKDDLMMELEKIAEQRYAIQTAPSHVTGIAVPIYFQDRAMASLGMFLPEFRFTNQFKERALKKLLYSAKRISEKLEVLRK